MNEPVLFGLPLSMAFLYFIVYSVLGWCMESVYCCIREKRFVPRGFLYGPMCPIYGVGVLMMICWFQPLMDRPVVFYLTATVCMSAWEYFVGWLLETVTHIKYWDYSMYKFNLHGRICLWVCLMWGVLSFLVLYFLHPQVARVLKQIPEVTRYVLDGFFLGVLTFDSVATIYQLARTSQMLSRLQQVGNELRRQAQQGRAGLSDMLAGAKEQFSVHLEELLPEQLDDAGKAMKARYDDLVTRAEFFSRRFRAGYRDMTAAGEEKEALESVKRWGEGVKRRRLTARRSRKQKK